MRLARSWLFVCVAAALCTACGGSGSLASNDGGTLKPGLEYSGALNADLTQMIEISAPVLPRVTVLYAQEGANFPTTLAAEQSLAGSAALVFEDLLNDCRTNAAYGGAYAGITAEPAPGAPALTSAQLDANYSLVAQCAYQQYTSKPYWIPKLIDDVDVCGTELGAGWALITEADLADLTAADYTNISDTLTSAAGDSGWGNFYFSLQVYVRGADGTLQLGDLRPGVANRVTHIATTVDQTSHLEGSSGTPVVLRCLRRS